MRLRIAAHLFSGRWPYLHFRCVFAERQLRLRICCVLVHPSPLTRHSHATQVMILFLLLTFIERSSILCSTNSWAENRMVKYWDSEPDQSQSHAWTSNSFGALDYPPFLGAPTCIALVAYQTLNVFQTKKGIYQISPKERQVLIEPSLFWAIFGRGEPS